MDENTEFGSEEVFILGASMQAFVVSHPAGLAPAAIEDPSTIKGNNSLYNEIWPSPQTLASFPATPKKVQALVL
jgi:hypothetical protein